MRLTLTSLLALTSLLSLAITASAAGCDCFDYTAADAGEKCDGGYSSNKMDIDEHCKRARGSRRRRCAVGRAVSDKCLVFLAVYLVLE